MTDKKELEALFRGRAGRIKAYAEKLLCGSASPEDAVSEVFMRVLRNADKFDVADEKETDRLFIIYTRSVCFNMMNKGRKFKIESLEEMLGRGEVEEELAARPEYDTVSSVVKSEDVRMLADAVDSLGEPAKGLIIMKYYNGMKNSEIAKLYGMNPMTVGTVLHRALANLRKRLEEMSYDPYD